MHPTSSEEILATPIVTSIPSVDETVKRQKQEDLTKLRKISELIEPFDSMDAYSKESSEILSQIDSRRKQYTIILIMRG